MSRLATIADGTNTYAAYKYLGAGQIVVEDYEDIEVKLDYSADNFAALDRFGRVLDQLWTDYGADPDVVLDHYSYTYDRAGNRTSRTNELKHDFDELYEYDGIDRLTSAVRADDFDQSWTLDGLGNFAEFDDDGDSQTRTANAVNEITNITGGWITPSHDAAGNMIAGPKPGDGAIRVHYLYDAWNRLVKIYDDDSGEPGDLIAEYEYDGTNRRIEKEVTGASHAHYYYNHDWQLLEERFVDEQDELLASNQYVWSARYIDAPIVRFHDGNGDGDLLDVDDNIRYYTGDANYNVTATIDSGTAEVVDRYVYTAYGKATVYDDEWTNPSAPATDGPLYCGYFFDAESALYQVRNRYYDAGLSTFISRDPIGYDGRDVNLYRYVGDSPLVRTDPTGLFQTAGDLQTQCYQVCAAQYPHWWQYHLYVGCISGCDGLYGGHDAQVDSGLVVGIGVAKVSCCDENGAKHSVILKKTCGGVLAGVSASTHGLANINGTNCPNAYQGYFFEWAAGIGVVGVSGEVGVFSPPGQSVKGGGGYIGVGIPVEAKLCYYTIIADDIDPCGCK